MIYYKHKNAIHAMGKLQHTAPPKVMCSKWERNPRLSNGCNNDLIPNRQACMMHAAATGPTANKHNSQSNAESNAESNAIVYVMNQPFTASKKSSKKIKNRFFTSTP
jgi:hypothetical protein